MRLTTISTLAAPHRAGPDRRYRRQVAVVTRGLHRFPNISRTSAPRLRGGYYSYSGGLLSADAYALFEDEP